MKSYKLMIVFTLLSGLLTGRAIAASPSDSPPTAPTRTPSSGLSQEQEAAQAKSQETWRARMLRVAQPKKGCFKATYPNTSWQKAPCTTAPLRPYPLSRGLRPTTVGARNDFLAQIAGFISTAVGSFDSVAGVTYERGYVNGNPPAVGNTFSLQLNANTFITPACNATDTPDTCRGWQQFIFSNAGYVFMQYWLLYVGACPTTGGWTFFKGDKVSEGGCYKNSYASAVPVQPIANLGQLTLTGLVGGAGSGTDMASLSVLGNLYLAQGDGGVLKLAQGWTEAEFNIVGDCCASQANFNSGTALVVRTSVDNGTVGLTNGPVTVPACINDGTTAETNNLTLKSTPPDQPLGTSSAIVFTESGDSTGTTATCALTIERNVVAHAVLPVTNFLLRNN